MGSLASMSLQTASVLGAAQVSHQRAGVARAQGDYASGVSDINAGLADAQAADATRRGAVNESRFRSGTKQLIGAQRAAAGSSGIDANSGSALDVQSDSARLGELDALTIRNNAAREAWGYSVQAANERTQGAMAKAAGENEASAKNAEAYSTLLTGAANIYTAWQRNPPSFHLENRPRASAYSQDTSQSTGDGTSQGGGGGGLPDGWRTWSPKDLFQWFTKRLGAIPGVQQAKNAVGSATNNYSGITVYQPKEPGK